MYRYFLKPLFFLLPPEKAHHLALTLLEWTLRLPLLSKWLRQFFRPQAPVSGVALAGLFFPNRIGLAAGFDKNGRHINALAALGFGFIEVGTVTPRPQAGNPRPRLFRLPTDEALINRMGFNNDGLEALVAQLKKPRPQGLIVGGNIGKNKDTPNEQALEDYLTCFDALFPWVDYFAVNVSSPNTPNLRQLQDKEPLTQLLIALQKRNNTHPKPKPILLKIAPDLSDAQMDDIVDIARRTGLSGIIATNTTVSRQGLQASPDTLERIGAGGLSGQPLRERATAVIQRLRAQLPPPFLLIGVGGIDSAAAVQEKLDAGADLVQLYTGLVYQGPGIVRAILNRLSKA